MKLSKKCKTEYIQMCLHLIYLKGAYTQACNCYSCDQGGEVTHLMQGRTFTIFKGCRGISRATNPSFQINWPNNGSESKPTEAKTCFIITNVHYKYKYKYMPQRAFALNIYGMYFRVQWWGPDQNPAEAAAFLDISCSLVVGDFQVQKSDAKKSDYSSQL